MYDLREKKNGRKDRRSSKAANTANLSCPPADSDVYLAIAGA